MSATHEWSDFPKIISLKRVSPLKHVAVSKQISSVYGQYKLKYDENNNPYYKSRTKTSEQGRYYYLKYVSEPDYKGWVLLVEEEHQYKFDMIQINGIQDTASDVLETAVKNGGPVDPAPQTTGITEEQKTENETVDYNDTAQDIELVTHGFMEQKTMNVEDIDDDTILKAVSHNQDEMLQALDKVTQKFRSFPTSKTPLEDDFWAKSVKCSNFEGRETNWRCSEEEEERERN